MSSSSPNWICSSKRQSGPFFRELLPPQRTGGAGARIQEPRTQEPRVQEPRISRSSRKQVVNGKARKRRCLRRFYCKNKFAKKCDSWILLHSNIRGYLSKAYSLETIVKNCDVVTINETLLKSNNTVEMPGFTCYSRNRQGSNGGGIATCVKSKDSPYTLKAFEGEDDDEILITRHGQFDIPINI